MTPACTCVTKPDAECAAHAPTVEVDRSAWPVLVKCKFHDGKPVYQLTPESDTLAVWPGADGVWYSTPDGGVGREFPTAREAADAVKARLPEEVPAPPPAIAAPKVGDRWGDLSAEQRAMVPVGSAMQAELDHVERSADGRWRFAGVPSDPYLSGDSELHPSYIVTRVGPALPDSIAEQVLTADPRDAEIARLTRELAGRTTDRDSLRESWNWERTARERAEVEIATLRTSILAALADGPKTDAEIVHAVGLLVEHANREEEPSENLRDIVALLALAGRGNESIAILTAMLRREVGL